MLEKYARKLEDYSYFLFRVLVGFMFASHGAQKLFGVLGGTVQPLMSLMGAAGVIELVVGVGVLVGLLTRQLALLGVLEMAVAYVMVHASNGLHPLVNSGELALMYLAALLVLFTYGAKEWSLDNYFKM